VPSEIQAATSAIPVVALLTRFFREQGFTTPLARIAGRLDRMLADPFCWCALQSIAARLRRKRSVKAPT
jgi:hypothetical protein